MSKAQRATRVRDQSASWPIAGSHVYLFDINILLALLDPMHAFHEAAHTWFDHEQSLRWATCPLTENGVVRIASQSKYVNSPGTAEVVAGTLSELCALPGHQFWADDVSLLDDHLFDHRKLASAHVTDTYLLALAVKHGGKLATFDKRLVADAVHGGKAALHVIR